MKPDLRASFVVVYLSYDARTLGWKVHDAYQTALSRLLRDLTKAGDPPATKSPTHSDNRPASSWSTQTSSPLSVVTHDGFRGNVHIMSNFVRILADGRTEFDSPGGTAKSWRSSNPEPTHPVTDRDAASGSTLNPAIAALYAAPFAAV